MTQTSVKAIKQGRVLILQAPGQKLASDPLEFIFFGPLITTLSLRRSIRRCIAKSEKFILHANPQFRSV